MKIKLILIFIAVIILHVKCSYTERKLLLDSKAVIELDGISDTQIVGYESDNAILYFGKEDVQKYSKQRLEETAGKVECEQLLEMLQESTVQELIIPDTFATKIAYDEFSGKLLRMRDQEHEFKYANDCFERVIIELVEAKKGKV